MFALQAIPQAAVARPAPAPAFTIDRRMMGADLAAWRASSPAAAQAVCTPSAAAPAVTLCRTADAALGGRYRVRTPTYAFLDGRLARIRFESSVDGFAYAMAVLKAAYGAPPAVTRDQLKMSAETTLPHVSAVWRGPRTTARLSDPTRDGGRLTVEVTLNAQAARLPAPAATAG